MTRFLDKSFSVMVGGDQTYRDNWDRIFSKKPLPCPAGHRKCLGVADKQHTCPYASEIHNDNSTLCECCAECEQECAWDI